MNSHLHKSTEKGLGEALSLFSSLCPFHTHTDIASSSNTGLAMNRTQLVLELRVVGLLPWLTSLSGFPDRGAEE